MRNWAPSTDPRYTEASANQALSKPTNHALRPARPPSSHIPVNLKRTEQGVHRSTHSTATVASIALAKSKAGWYQIVRNFRPSWFSVTMGTGIVSVLFISIPFKTPWLYYLSIIFFLLNLTLFCLALGALTLQYFLYPDIWMSMIRDPINYLLLGTLPMGFATLVEMWVFVCVPLWGPWAITVAWVLWMIDVLVAATITLSLTFVLMLRDDVQTLDQITATQLLPIAATIVAAGTGAEVAKILPDPQHALGTIIACYVLWGLSVPLAMVTLVIYFERLTFHKLPSQEVIVSCFLPLGPLGFGGYGIIYLGKMARIVLPQTVTLDPVAGSVLYVLGFFIGLVMWSFGIIWLVFALATLGYSRHFPFNMSWWGFTFPLGVFSVSTIQLGIEMPSLYFKILGTIFSVVVIILWIMVTVGTIKGAWSGELFVASCIVKSKERTENPSNYLAPARTV